MITSSPSRKVLPFGRLKTSNGFFGSTCLFASSGLAGICCDGLVSTRNICRCGGETNVVAVVCALSFFEAHAAGTSANRTINTSRFPRLLIRLAAYTMNRKIRLCLITLTLLIAAITFIVGCGRNTTPISGTFTPETQPLPTELAGYEPMTIPADNPMTPEKVALGRQLFFDERLSIDGSRSCYSCHVCEHGLTDGLPKAIGAGNRQLTRSSPTLWNIGYHKEFYWDGRSNSLEAQALAAWKGANMGVGDKTADIVAKINAFQGYKAQFQKVFHSDATPENMMKAIAAYERTIIGGNTARSEERRV